MTAKRSYHDIPSAAVLSTGDSNTMNGIALLGGTLRLQQVPICGLLLPGAA